MSLRTISSSSFDPNANSEILPYGDLRSLEDPVTLDPMEQSVVDPCGHTFDKNTTKGLIEQYVQQIKEQKPGIKEVDIDRGYFCPLSSKFVAVSQLYPNLALDHLHNDLKTIFHKKIKEVANQHPDVAVRQLLVENNAYMDRQEKRMEALSSKCDVLMVTNNELTKRCDLYFQKIEERDKTIANLAKESEEHKNNLNDSRKEVADKDKKLKDTASELDKKSNELKEKNDELTKKNEVLQDKDKIIEQNQTQLLIGMTGAAIISCALTRLIKA